MTLQGPPTFDTVEEERLQRKQSLAGALRVFGRLGFGEGVAGHITVRDPEFPDHFWVNPFGLSFRHMRVSDLILVNHQGEVVYGDRPVNRAAFVIHAAIHAARPDIVAAAHAHSVYGKAFSSLAKPLLPITQDACIFYEDHLLIADQGGAVVFDVEAGKQLAAAFPRGKAAIHQNHGLFTVGQTVEEAAFWFVSMERSCQAQLAAEAAGTPTVISHEFATHTREQHGRSRSPGGSASSRSGRRSAAPTRNCSISSTAAGRSVGPVGRFLDEGSPEALFVISAIAQYVGASIAVTLFDQISPASVAWLRVIGAAIALLAVSWRSVRRGFTRPELAAAAVFGIATALMNLLFYLAIDRIPLGKGVAIEFIGPICVAAARTRTRRNAGALGARRDRRDRAVGVRGRHRAARALVHLRGVGDVGRLHRRRLDRSPASTAACPGSASAWRSAPSPSPRSARRAADRRGRLPRCSSPACWSACSRTRSDTASTSTCCAGSRCAASRCCSPCCR